ncbi:MAG: hypothetical protein HY778_14125 [Betaproteobacteria bacterium]|nr:hypothetical protein [Betaproteobacteria bacterium]
MKFTRLRMRRGIAAQRVSIRNDAAWSWRAGLVLVVALGLGAGGFWFLRGGGTLFFEPAPEHAAELNVARERVVELERELDKARVASPAESEVQMARAAQQQLMSQVKSLEEENARLKEEIGLYQSLASRGAEGGVTIEGLRVEPSGSDDGSYRYRMMVALVGGKLDREFKGSYQLLVNLQQGGRSAIIHLPGERDANKMDYVLKFRRYRRIEGLIQVPAGAQVKRLEVRLMQDGATKASKIVTL